MSAQAGPGRTQTRTEPTASSHPAPWSPPSPPSPPPSPSPSHPASPPSSPSLPAWKFLCKVLLVSAARSFLLETGIHSCQLFSRTRPVIDKVGPGQTGESGRGERRGDNWLVSCKTSYGVYWDSIRPHHTRLCSDLIKLILTDEIKVYFRPHNNVESTW